MDRRVLLKSLITGGVAALTLPVRRAEAAVVCTPFDFRGLQECESGLLSDLMGVEALDVQHQSEWCWAASISMVFAYYGHEVSQEEIVRQAWGQVGNMPGGPAQILGSLNRRWIDSDENTFSARADVMSANVITAAQDLAADRPLIIGTLGHAMVLTAITYVRSYNGNGQVLSATVRDPWPGRGERNLLPQEWYQTSFLARVRVS